MNPFKKLAGQTAIYGIPTIVGRLLNYLLVPLYTNKFVPAEYGVVTEMYAYSSFLLIILTYGMETALFNFSQKEADKNLVYSTSLISIIVSSFFFIAICSFFSVEIASLIGHQKNTEYIIWFAMILSFDAITSIPFARLREQNKPYKFAFAKSINILINIFLNVFFIKLCNEAYNNPSHYFHSWSLQLYNPQIRIGYIFIANVVASAITILLLMPEFVGIHWKFSRTLWKKMMVYALPLTIGGLAGIINETMDRILLKYLLPDRVNAIAQLGIYGACYKIAILMTIFIQTFRFAAEPFFFSQAKEKNPQKIYADVMKYFVIACSFIFLTTMMYIDIIKYFIGKAYWEGLPVVPILLLANLFLGIFFNLSIWYKLSGQTKYGAYLSIFGAIITLVLNFWWIPTIGYMGSAWATLICYGSMMVASYYIGQKNYPIHYDLKRILGYVSLSLLLYFISTYVFTNQVGLIKTSINSSFICIYILVVLLMEKNVVQNRIK